MRIMTVVLTLVAFSASAQADAKCELAKPIDGQRLLRRLSLDLRGYTPSYQEAVDQRGSAEVSAAKLDSYIQSADFVGTMRKYHEQLLWPNLDSAELDPLQQKLFRVDMDPGMGEDFIYFSILRALFLRSVTQQFPICRNEPATFDAQGQPVMTPLVVNGQTVAMQEGYVMVEPYWAPGTQVKVCALDAMAPASGTGRICTAKARMSPYMNQTCNQFGVYPNAVQPPVPFNDAPIACDSAFAFLSSECGCGPNLRLCQTDETAARLRRSLIDQQMRVVEDVVSQDLPYTEVLTRMRVPMNGAIAHYLRYQSRASFELFGETDATNPIPPQLSYLDDTWVNVDRGGRHSGILTTPGYLLKYMSNRGRAHRFYNAFECSSFIPGGPLPSPQEACSKHEDLTKRCGCDACHIRLEPMSAHWGRFAEYGFTPLDEGRYPRTAAGVCTNFQSIDQLFRCFRFYNVQPVGEEEAYRNQLRPYVFRTPDEVAKLETGPRALAQASIDSGAFASCTTRKLWGYYMRREPTPDEESTVIPTLAADFKSGGYKIKDLVKKIVTQPAYRRMP